MIHRFFYYFYFHIKFRSQMNKPLPLHSLYYERGHDPAYERLQLYCNSHLIFK